MSEAEIEEKLRRAINRVLTRNYDNLPSHIAAANPRSVGKKLVADGVVAADAFNSIEHLDNRDLLASRLFNHAKPVMEYDSAKFRKFLEILFDFEPCVKVATKICQEMRKGQ